MLRRLDYRDMFQSGATQLVRQPGRTAAHIGGMIRLNTDRRKAHELDQFGYRTTVECLEIGFATTACHERIDHFLERGWLPQRQFPLQFAKHAGRTSGRDRRQAVSRQHAHEHDTVPDPATDAIDDRDAPDDGDPRGVAGACLAVVRSLEKLAPEGARVKANPARKGALQQALNEVDRGDEPLATQPCGKPHRELARGIPTALSGKHHVERFVDPFKQALKFSFTVHAHPSNLKRRG
jgi:hypothetical protein